MNNYYEDLNKEDNHNSKNNQFQNRKQKISKNDINFQHNYLREKKRQFHKGERLLSNNYIKSLKTCYNYLKVQDNPRQQRRRRKKNLIKNFIYRKNDFAYDLTKKTQKDNHNPMLDPIEFSDTQSESYSEYSSSDSSRIIEVLPRKKPMEILSLSEQSESHTVQQSQKSIQIIKEKPASIKQSSSKKSEKEPQKILKNQKKDIQSPKIISKKLNQVSTPKIKNTEKQKEMKSTNKTKDSLKQKSPTQKTHIEQTQQQQIQQNRNCHVRELDQVIRSLSVIFEIDQNKLNSMIEKYNGDMEKK